MIKMKTLLLFLTTLFGCHCFDIPALSFSFSIPSAADWDISDMMPLTGGGLPGMDMLSNLKDRFSSIMLEPKLDDKDIKTTVKNETRGNMHVTTIEKNGKNFHMISQMSSLQAGNASAGNTSSLPFLIFGGDFEQAMKADRQTQCSGKKQCSTGKYCDPMASKCRKKLSEGATCVLKDQCAGEGIICIWGRCNKAKAGDPGTFCKHNTDCKGDSSCNMRRSISPYHPVCSPRLDVGSVCGRSNPLRNLFTIASSREEEEDRNPCKKGLKCIIVGMFGTKLCVSEESKIKSGDKKVEKTEKNSGTGDDESDEDDGSADPSDEKVSDIQDDQNEKNPPEVKKKKTPNLPGETDPMNPPEKTNKKKRFKGSK